MNLFKIDGYWRDDKTEFYGYLVAEYDDAPDEDEEDNIFYYGLSEDDIKKAIKNDENNTLDFVITNYTKINK